MLRLGGGDLQKICLENAMVMVEILKLKHVREF